MGSSKLVAKLLRHVVQPGGTRARRVAVGRLCWHTTGDHDTIHIDGLELNV